MQRSRLLSLLAIAGTLMFVAGSEADEPAVALLAISVIATAVSGLYDSLFETLLRGRRRPVPRDLGLWLLCWLVTGGIGGAIELMMRPPDPDGMALIEWLLQLGGCLIPVTTTLAAVRFAGIGERPRFSPIIAGPVACALYWTAGWLTWTIATTVLVDPLKISPELTLWISLPLSPLLAIGALLWWRGLCQSPYLPFDDSNLFRRVVAIVMAVTVVLLIGTGVLVLAPDGGLATQRAVGRAVAWLLAAVVALSWLVVFRRVRTVPPPRAWGAVAAIAILVVALGASIVLPICFEDASGWWPIFFLLLAPILFGIVVAVLTLAPRAMLAALRH